MSIRPFRSSETGPLVVAVVVALVLGATGCGDDGSGGGGDGDYKATAATNVIDASLASRLSFATTIAGTYCIQSRLAGDADIAALQAAGADKPLDLAVARRLARGVEDCGADLLITSVVARIGADGVAEADASTCRAKIESVQSSSGASADPIPLEVVAAHLSDATLLWSLAEVGC